MLAGDHNRNGLNPSICENAAWDLLFAFRARNVRRYGHLKINVRIIIYISVSVVFIIYCKKI